MKVQDWMTTNVQYCHPDTTMNEAAHKMWAGDYGVLPVVGSDRRVEGMITDRDICMGACFQGRRLGEMIVQESMSRDVTACHAGDSIDDAIRCMGHNRVRRLPVLDQDGKLVGILSLNDVARRLPALNPKEHGRIASRLLDAMAAICQARVCTLPESETTSRSSARHVLVP